VKDAVVGYKGAINYLSPDDIKVPFQWWVRKWYIILEKMDPGERILNNEKEQEG